MISCRNKWYGHNGNGMLPTMDRCSLCGLMHIDIKIIEIMHSIHADWDHYSDVIVGAVAFQITSLKMVYSTVYSGADQRKHQHSASLADGRGIYRWPVNSTHKGTVTRKISPFDNVIMTREYSQNATDVMWSVWAERSQREGVNLPALQVKVTSEYCHIY